VAAAHGRVPSPPRLGRAIRTAAEDLYYNSWRFFGANLIFGVGLLAIALLSVGGLAFLILLVLLTPVAAGTMRMATTMVRNRHTDFGELVDELRRPWRSLALGAAQLFFLFVLVIDLLLGVAIQRPLGTFLSVSGLYGVFILWLYATLAWPIVLDPIRAGLRLRERLRLAALLMLAYPLRMAGLALLLAALVVFSTLTVAPILMISVAFTCLVAAHCVLPAADRLEGRKTIDAVDPSAA